MFSNRLVALVKERKISQSALARALNVHRQQVYDWSSGKSKPTHEALKKLAQYFGVTVDYLLSETEDDEMVIINTGTLAAHNSKISVGETLSQQEHELIRLFRSLPVKDQVQLLSELYKKEGA